MSFEYYFSDLKLLICHEDSYAFDMAIPLCPTEKIYQNRKFLTVGYFFVLLTQFWFLKLSKQSFTGHLTAFPLMIAR